MLFSVYPDVALDNINTTAVCEINVFYANICRPVDQLLTLTSVLEAMW